MITVARRLRRRSSTFITPALSTTFGAPDARTMPNPILGRLSSPALGECGRRRYLARIVHCGMVVADARQRRSTCIGLPSAAQVPVGAVRGYGDEEDLSADDVGWRDVTQQTRSSAATGRALREGWLRP
jgi:hypothetical protein